MKVSKLFFINSHISFYSYASLHFLFMISTPVQRFSLWFPSFPPISRTATLMSHISNRISHIPCTPTPVHTFPPDSPHSHHSPHSVPQFPFQLLQITFCLLPPWLKSSCFEIVSTEKIYFLCKICLFGRSNFIKKATILKTFDAF